MSKDPPLRRRAWHVTSAGMESLPELPASTELRAFVIWATAGLLGIALGTGTALIRKSWVEAGRAALPICVIALGVLIGHIAASTHIWAMWGAVATSVWAAHRNDGLSSFFVFLGSLGLAAASIMAHSLF